MKNKYVNFLSYLLFLIIWTSSYAERPELYDKPPYVMIEHTKINGAYKFNYRYRNLLNEEDKIVWSESVDNILSNDGLGIAQYIVDSGNVTEEDAVLGMFKVVGDYIQVDYTRFIHHYRPLMIPFYLKYYNDTQKLKLSRYEKIEYLLRIFQDYPYGLIPQTYEGKFINGILPINAVFKEGYADCDTKSLMMAMVLSYDKDFYNRLAMILVPGHALLGINMLAKPYQKTVRYLGRDYIYTEPVGTARTPLGQTNSPYSNSINVIPLELVHEKVDVKNSASEIDHSLSTNSLKDNDCPDGGLLIEFESVTGDKNQFCQKNDGVKFINHGPALIKSHNGDITRKYFKDGVEIDI